MQPTIARFKDAVPQKSEAILHEVLTENVTFSLPTYWATWTGRAPVAAVLGHVIEVFSDFQYRRILTAAVWARGRIGRWRFSARLAISTPSGSI